MVKSYSNKRRKTGATGEVGHYTQNVWATTEVVGCGLIKYADDSNWITTVSLSSIIE